MDDPMRDETANSRPDHYCEECEFGTNDLEEWRAHNEAEHFD